MTYLTIFQFFLESFFLEKFRKKSSMSWVLVLCKITVTYYVNLIKIKLIIDGQKFVLQSGINLNCKKQLSTLKIQS